MQTPISTKEEKWELPELKTSVTFPTQLDFAKPGARSTAAWSIQLNFLQDHRYHKKKKTSMNTRLQGILSDTYVILKKHCSIYLISVC